MVSLQFYPTKTWEWALEGLTKPKTISVFSIHTQMELFFIFNKMNTVTVSTRRKSVWEENSNLCQRVSPTATPGKHSHKLFGEDCQILSKISHVCCRGGQGRDLPNNYIMKKTTKTSLWFFKSSIL